MPGNKNVLKHVHPPNPTCFQQVSFTSRRIHSVATSVATRSSNEFDAWQGKRVKTRSSPQPNLFPTGFLYQNSFGGDPGGNEIIE
ncbi:MAG TPA: hypothetical protein VGD99_02120 [Anaerolineae bacterium]